MTKPQPLTTPSRSAKSPSASNAFKLALISAQGSLGAPVSIKRPKDDENNTRSGSSGANTSTTASYRPARESGRLPDNSTEVAEPHNLPLSHPTSIAPDESSSYYRQQLSQHPSSFQLAYSPPDYRQQIRHQQSQTQPLSTQARPPSQLGQQPPLQETQPIGIAVEGAMSVQSSNISSLTSRSVSNVRKLL